MNVRPTPDDYARLGVKTRATAREVTSAYRALAMREHPDHNPRPDAAQQFAELHASYVLVLAACITPELVATTPRPTPVATEPAAIGDMEVGDVGWTLPDALLIAPDRGCFLAPYIIPAPYITAVAHMRIERTPDGFSVTFAHDIDYRWVPSPYASRVGVAVNTVIFGPESVEQRIDTQTAALLPSYFLSATVDALQMGAPAWTVASALVMDDHFEYWLDGSESVSTEPSFSAPLKIELQVDGYHVFLHQDRNYWKATRRHPLHGIAVHAVHVDKVGVI